MEKQVEGSRDESHKGGSRAKDVDPVGIKQDEREVSPRLQVETTVCEMDAATVVLSEE